MIQTPTPPKTPLKLPFVMSLIKANKSTLTYLHNLLSGEDNFSNIPRLVEIP